MNHAHEFKLEWDNTPTTLKFLSVIRSDSSPQALSSSCQKSSCTKDGPSCLSALEGRTLGSSPDVLYNNVNVSAFKSCKLKLAFASEFIFVASPALQFGFCCRTAATTAAYARFADAAFFFRRMSLRWGRNLE